MGNLSGSLTKLVRLLLYKRLMSNKFNLFKLPVFSSWMEPRFCIW